MLEELHVRDLALIEDVWLEFGPGMTALTGETGAGKTALVEALQLLVGERADSTLVRSGAAEAVVEGRFATGSGEVVAKRRVTAEGRSRCTLGGEMATVGALEETLGPMVDLHGQHEHQALLSPARHATYLDRSAGPSAQRASAAYREAFDAAGEAAVERDALAAALSDRDARIAALRESVAQIDSVAPKPGEDEELERRLPGMRHAERLAEAAGLAHARLTGEPGAAEALSEALGALVRVRELDPELDRLAASLAGASEEVDRVASLLREYGEGLVFDPRELDAAEGRLAALRALQRRHGPTIEDVLAVRERDAAEAAALEEGERGLAVAEERVAECERRLAEAAAELGAVRREAAARLLPALCRAAGDLAMPDARFDVAFAELPRGSWTREGPGRAEFLFSASGGEEPRPLARIASGGEVSRVMLALKGVLGAADDVPVLVFDEVDAGIGGATADAVGRRLLELSRDHQVLVVTHLAQVAAYADSHVVVEKEAQDARTVTKARAVHGEERVAEIARMLSGEGSSAGVAHARELLERAAAVRVS